MEEQDKRRVEEVVTLHQLEPELNTIYVEGPMDRIILEMFIDTTTVNCSVREITDINFESLPFDERMYSNRFKVVTLSSVIINDADGKLDNVLCVVDKDFDSLIDESKLLKNRYLLRTDYNSLEGYILTEKNINKIIKLFFGGGKINYEKIMKEFKKVLPVLFALKFMKEEDVEFKSNKEVEVDKSCEITKHGDITVDVDKIIAIYCQNNRVSHEKVRIRKIIDKIIIKLDDDLRNSMHGHDFTKLFYKYFCKVKNKFNLDYPQTERALFLSIEIDNLLNYEMFKQLVARFER